MLGMNCCGGHTPKSYDWLQTHPWEGSQDKMGTDWWPLIPAAHCQAVVRILSYIDVHLFPKPEDVNQEFKRKRL